MERRDPNLEIDRAWKEFLSGDDKFFDQLYNEYVQILFIYGLQFTSDRELLKDCIQDTFIKLFEVREQLHHVTNLGLYLRIALKNRLINSLNREKIYSKSIDVTDISPVEENAIDQNMMYEEEILLRQQKIETIMTLLTPQQREAIRYRYVEDRSLEEISTRMGVNYQSTQNTLQRAIKKIKKYFIQK